MEEKSLQKRLDLSVLVYESKMIKVFISIINYNSLSETKACLASLQKVDQKGIALSTIVIDNGSSESCDLSEKEYKEICLTVIKNEANTGFSGGHNRAIQYALSHDAEYVVILNNDTIVQKNFLKHLLEPFEKDGNVGVTVPKIYFVKGSEFHKDWYAEKERGKVLWYAGADMDWANVLEYHKGVDEVDRGQFDTQEKTAFATGCCMCVKIEVFLRVGMFDEKYFLYYEDSDLSMRVKRAGFSIVYVPQAVIWHKNASSTGGSGSALQDYYTTRNRLVFGMKYASVRAKTALLKESLRLLYTGRMWQKTGVKDYYLRRFGKGTFFK